MFKWIYYIVIIIALGLAAYAAFYFYKDESSSVDLVLKLPEKVMVGESFMVTIGVINGSGNILNGARLTLTLPEGMAFVGEEEDKNVQSKNLGDVGVGGLTSQEFRVIALKDTNSNKDLEASLNYGMASSASRFEEKKTFSLAVGDSAIDLKIEVPEKAVSNDQFEIKVNYKNNSNGEINDLKFKIEYPPVFKFSKASLKPDEDDMLWDLGGLRSGSENKFSIFGSLIAPSGTALNFKASLQMALEGKNYDINEQTVSTTIDSAPFDLQVKVNGGGDYIAHPGDVLNYMISFSEQINYLKIELNGEMLDLSGLGSNILTWNNPLSPIEFQARVKSDYPIKRLGDKNFLLKASAEGRLGKEIAVAKLETKIGGQAKIVTKGYFRDASSGILNRGVMPPKVGEATTFTIHWLLSNYGTDIRNIKIIAPLAGGIRFIGNAKSSFGATPVYDANNNIVTWQIDRLLATQGVIDQPLEAVFQIEAVPTTDMVGQYMPLVGETRLSANDEFANQEIFAVSPAVTTALPDDPTVGPQGVVVK